METGRQLDDRSNQRPWQNSIGRIAVSLISVLLTQFSLCSIPWFFPSFSQFTQLCISGFLLVLVLGLASCCKRLLHVGGSALAFVFFSMCFVWCVYFTVVHQANSTSVDFLLNVLFVLLVIGLCRIMSADPGIVTHGFSCRNKLLGSPCSEVDENSEDPVSVDRVRYCRYCMVHVKKFDHHCPAFGNCIGQRNHFLFVILLAAFIICEAFYVVCAFQFAQKLSILRKHPSKIGLSENLASSTMLFCALQVLWQVIFLIWHLYCICSNIATDEWINWKKYPEFQVVQCQIAEKPIFVNPYDKGILWNLKEFFHGGGNE